MDSEQRLHRETAYWQHILTMIAQDIERTAEAETDPKRKAWFSGRAMRIRQRLHEGMPEDFEGTPGHQRMTTGK